MKSTTLRSALLPLAVTLAPSLAFAADPAPIAATPAAASVAAPVATPAPAASPPVTPPAAPVSAATARGHLEIMIADRRGAILVDGKPVGEGSFISDLPAGEHTITVTREGYESFEKKITLLEKQSLSETVSLKRAAVEGKPGTAVSMPVAAVSDDGLYGGFGIVGNMMPWGSGNALEAHCTSLGATSCDTPTPVGGGLFGYMGYSFAPIGFEAMLGGLVDISRPTAHMAGAGPASPSQNAGFSSAARTEEFNFARAGGIGALRIRATAQTSWIRGSLAAGFGAAYRYYQMTRTVTAADGQTADAYAPSGVAHLVPALSFDGSVQVRLSQHTALMLGLMAWIESAPPTSDADDGKGNASQSDKSRIMLTIPPSPLPTPQYQYASDVQVFIGPYLGMQFGP